MAGFGVELTNPNNGLTAEIINSFHMVVEALFLIIRLAASPCTEDKASPMIKINELEKSNRIQSNNGQHFITR